MVPWAKAKFAWSNVAKQWDEEFKKNYPPKSKSLEDIGKTALINNKNQVIYLKDLAEIKEGSLPTISAASINGDEGIYLSVQGQLGADTYKLTQLIESAVKDISPRSNYGSRARTRSH